jgi:hypothetical protein
MNRYLPDMAFPKALDLLVLPAPCEADGDGAVGHRVGQRADPGYDLRAVSGEVDYLLAPCTSSVGPWRRDGYPH